MKSSAALNIAMRLVLLLIALMVIFALLGWITFRPGPERSTINIEKQEIREDTRELLDSGSKILHQAEEGIDRAADHNEPAANGQRAQERRKQAAKSVTLIAAQPAGSLTRDIASRLH